MWDVQGPPARIHGRPTSSTGFPLILLPAGTSIVLPVGYMDQPTGRLHISLWRRLCGRQGRRLFKSGDNVVNAKGRTNEIGQSWCPADQLDFQ